MSRDSSGFDKFAGFDNFIELNYLYPGFVYGVKVYLESPIGYYSPHIHRDDPHEGTWSHFFQKMRYNEKEKCYYCHFYNDYGRGTNLGFVDTIKMVFNGDLSSIVMETGTKKKIFNFMSKERREKMKILFLCVRRKFPHIISTLEEYYKTLHFSENFQIMKFERE